MTRSSEVCSHRWACDRWAQVFPRTRVGMPATPSPETRSITRGRSGRGSSGRSSRHGSAFVVPRRPHVRRRAIDFSRRSSTIWRPPVWVTCRRSPTVMRRSHRADAHSRPGRWLRSCGSTARFLPSSLRPRVRAATLGGGLTVKSRGHEMPRLPRSADHEDHRPASRGLPDRAPDARHRRDRHARDRASAGRDRGTVKTRLHRARQALAGLLEPVRGRATV